MTTSFPGALDGFTNPVGSDSESTIPHHIQHTNANDAIAALEQKVGVNNSSVTSTLDYLVKTAANPGHSHTGSVSFNNIQVTGSTAQAGAGIWSDGTSLFLTTASSLGAVYVRPNGPSNHSYQMVVASSGQISSTDAGGAVRNSLDLGNGNASIAGNLHVTGTLSVTGAANLSIPFPTGSENPKTTTTLTLDPTTGSNDGVLVESARSDHSHHIDAFNDAVIPSAPSGSPAVGISTYAARADHQHQSEQDHTGMIKMWAGPLAVTAMTAGVVNLEPVPGYLTCDGSSVSQARYSSLYALITTTYGNISTVNGVALFALPDFRGVSPVGVGQPVAGTPGDKGAPTLLGNYYGATSGLVPLTSHGHTVSGVTSAMHTHNFPTTDFYTVLGGSSGKFFGNYTTGLNQYNFGISGPGYGSSPVITSGPSPGGGTDANGTTHAETISGSTSTDGTVNATVATVTPSLGINFLIKY